MSFSVHVYSIRDMFVCSLVKTFGHLSDKAKKTVIDRIITLETILQIKSSFRVRLLAVCPCDYTPFVEKQASIV